MEAINNIEIIAQNNLEKAELVIKNSGVLEVYRDNEDPWGMTVEGFNEYAGEFTLLSDADANAFNGYPDETLANVRVIENGDVRLKIQAIFGYSKSFAVVTYSLPKNGNYIDIKIKILSNDSSRFYKLSFDTSVDSAEFIGQTAFGTENLRTGGDEAVFQKWCAVSDGKKSLAILNKGTYGGSVDGNILNISLLRTPVYSAHPICDRPLADSDRNHDRIDIGEREFEYRLTADTDNVDMQAELFNKPCIALSFFPSGAGEINDTRIEVSNPRVILSRFRKNEDDVTVRFYNSSDKPEKTRFAIKGKNFEINLGAFEVKTFSYANSNITETDMIV